MTDVAGQHGNAMCSPSLKGAEEETIRSSGRPLPFVSPRIFLRKSCFYYGVSQELGTCSPVMSSCLERLRNM